MKHHWPDPYSIPKGSSSKDIIQSRMTQENHPDLLVLTNQLWILASGIHHFSNQLIIFLPVSSRDINLMVKTNNTQFQKKLNDFQDVLEHQSVGGEWEQKIQNETPEPFQRTKLCCGKVTWPQIYTPTPVCSSKPTKHTDWMKLPQTFCHDMIVYTATQ